jgi:hypothetical protein
MNVTAVKETTAHQLAKSEKRKSLASTFVNDLIASGVKKSWTVNTKL